MVSKEVFSARSIDVNTATSSEIESLPGIGSVLAENIVRYREETGGFRKIDELKKVRGIGDKRFNAIKGRVTIAE